MYKVDIEIFEGPMDLLIHLIKKKEVSIYNIPISEITEEFLDYINRIKRLNIPLASEFLVMAATLTKIKSEMLMKNRDSKDPRKELVRAIEEYIRLKRGTEKLEIMEEKASQKFSNKTSDIVFKFQDKVKIQNTPEEIAKTFSELINRKFSKKVVIGINLNSDKFKISSKVHQIRKILKENHTIEFSHLTRISSCKLEAVVFFLALLELCKLGEATIFPVENDLIISKICKLPFNNVNFALEEANPVNIGNPI